MRKNQINRSKYLNTLKEFKGIYSLPQYGDQKNEKIDQDSKEENNKIVTKNPDRKIKKKKGKDTVSVDKTEISNNSMEIDINCEDLKADLPQKKNKRKRAEELISNESEIPVEQPLDDKCKDLESDKPKKNNKRKPVEEIILNEKGKDTVSIDKTEISNNSMEIDVNCEDSKADLPKKKNKRKRADGLISNMGEIPVEQPLDDKCKDLENDKPKKNNKRKPVEEIVLNETEISEQVAKKKRKTEMKFEENDELMDINQGTKSTEISEIKDKINTEKLRMTRKSFIMITNINKSISTEEINDYLKENAVTFNSVMDVPGCVGLAGFKREKELSKLFNICQGVRYKNNELYICKAKIDKAFENSTTNFCESSIHIKNLDPLIKLKDIRVILTDIPVKNVSINTEKRTAVIDFDNENLAKSAIALFDQKKIGGNVTQANFLLKSQRPDMFTIKVTNLPENTTKTEIRAIFNNATKIKQSIKTPDQCLINFKNAEDMEAVLNDEAGFSIKDTPVTIERLTLKEHKEPELKSQYVLNVFNLPFDTTVEELKQNYENVRYVEMLKNAEGKFGGSAKLMFVEKEWCEEALKKSKGLIFKHRRVRAEMKIEESMQY